MKQYNISVDTTLGGNSPSDEIVASQKAIKTYVDANNSGSLNYAGSVAYASLPTPAAGNVGNIYNVTDAFTTDSKFIGGASKAYPAGTNVLIVEYIGTVTTTYYAWEEPFGADIWTTSTTPVVGDKTYSIVGDVVTEGSTISEVGNDYIKISGSSRAYSREPLYDTTITTTGTVYLFDIFMGDISGKQDTLVSGTNIKTINNTSLLGSGNINISGGSSTLSDLTDTTISNPSNGQALTYDNSSSKWVNTSLSIPTVDQVYSATSTNAQSGTAVASAISTKQDVLTAGTDLSINTITSGKNKFDVVTMGTDMNVSLYTDNYISRLDNNSGVIVPILPNTTYTVSTAAELTVFRIGTYPTIISKGDSVRANAYVKHTNNNPITFTSAANDHYLYIQVNSALFSTAITTLQVEEGTTATTYTAYQNIPSTVITFTNDTGYITKSGGSTSQTISLTSGTGTTALGVKSASTTSSYISFTSASAWLGSIGVNSSKKPVFYNGVGYTLAYTSDIPTIATSVSASSTNAETVGAKLFYDTCGDIESLINAL